ncbi:MAG: hypothetical protein NZT92_19100, partial [Abditibacteriales bacterium]|nr:hypothetical protein [Abditibacteriales bacterium]
MGQTQVPCLTLRGVFVAPDLVRQGMERRLGRGEIDRVVLLDSHRVLVISGGGAGVFDLSGDGGVEGGKALWEIDYPASCGALSPDGRWLALG